eukprot:TRINITY_DN120075_c0_g1_i1.p1 TRINITY_DN120075_c0_g1~~TRINITY_DN120075_c0_g1_i1.p1  ORF type:complete len:249 (+),score=65.14 TRINITY_DN120075_c0_g1_i1:67-747(+)
MDPRVRPGSPLPGMLLEHLGQVPTLEALSSPAVRQELEAFGASPEMAVTLKELDAKNAHLETLESQRVAQAEQKAAVARSCLDELERAFQHERREAQAAAQRHLREVESEGRRAFAAAEQQLRAEERALAAEEDLLARAESRVKILKLKINDLEKRSELFSYDADLCMKQVAQSGQYFTEKAREDATRRAKGAREFGIAESHRLETTTNSLPSIKAALAQNRIKAA